MSPTKLLVIALVVIASTSIAVHAAGTRVDTGHYVSYDAQNNRIGEANVVTDGENPEGESIIVYTDDDNPAENATLQYRVPDPHDDEYDFTPENDWEVTYEKLEDGSYKWTKVNADTGAVETGYLRPA